MSKCQCFSLTNTNYFGAATGKQHIFVADLCMYIFIFNVTIEPLFCDKILNKFMR